MRFIIDTELNKVIIPEKYIQNLDAINKIRVDAGADRLDAKSFVKDAFDKAYPNDFVRANDAKGMTTRKGKSFSF